MKNLSDHIMDIVQNSTRAKAASVDVILTEQEGRLRVEILDDGCGMDEEAVKRVTDPFFTSRTTRKVGMGIPLFQQSAMQTEGGLSIESKPGEGTRLEARFNRQHIDCPPLGDLHVTMALLITGNPDVNFRFRYGLEERVFEMSTEEIKEALDGMDMRQPKVTSFLKEMIKENLIEIGVQFE